MHAVTEATKIYVRAVWAAAVDFVQLSLLNSGHTSILYIYIPPFCFSVKGRKTSIYLGIWYTWKYLRLHIPHILFYLP